MSALQAAVIDLARRAGEAILPHYRAAAAIAVTDKADGSPLTAADLAAHHLIVDALAALQPALPVLSEESEDQSWERRHGWTRFWLVDPLDGTKEFVQRSGEFTVNIALIEDGLPIFGVVHAPAIDQTYWGGRGMGAWRSIDRAQAVAISAAPRARHPRLVVASRRHRGADLDGYLAALGEHQVLDRGSSLKFCLVAEGSADCYPRFVPTMEWDTGAGQAVLEGAGGAVLAFDGSPLGYNKPRLENPYFLAFADPALAPGR